MPTNIQSASRHHLGLLTLVVLAVGCSRTTTAPEPAEGTFVLHMVAGETLPTAVRVDQFGGEYLAETLRFTAHAVAGATPFAADWPAGGPWQIAG